MDTSVRRKKCGLVVAVKQLSKPLQLAVAAVAACREWPQAIVLVCGHTNTAAVRVRCNA
jgi:hypothetical protein